MRRRTLGFPLLVVAGALGLLTLAGAAATIRQAWEFGHQLDEGVAPQAHLIRALHNLGDAMSRERANAIKAGYSVDRDQRAEIDAQFRRSIQRFDAADAELLRLTSADPASAALIEPLKSRWMDYTKRQEGIFAAALLGPDAAAPPRLDKLPQLNELCNIATSNAYGEVIAALNDALAKTEGRLDRALQSAARPVGVVVPVQSAQACLVLCACCWLAWFTRRRVVAPLRSVGESLRRIASGQIDEAVPLADEREEVGRLARNLDRLREGLCRARKEETERKTLSQLTDWLQSVKSEAELYTMVSEVLARLIPDCAGALYVYTASRDALELARSWNGADAPVVMGPDDCWGLRRGQHYVHTDDRVAFRCGHASSGSGHNSCCIPLLAHGETIGLLHLDHRPSDRGDAFEANCRLGALACEHIALAIANVKLREQLLDQSIRDVLTGLHNRRYMLARGQTEIQRAQGLGLPVSVLSIDIDHFKVFNDSFGHDAGDAVLRCVADLLRTCAGPDDVACRFGGEEFLLLIPSAAAEEAARRAEAIRRSTEALAVRYAGTTLPRISVSIGVAAYPDAGETLAEILKAADTTLYEAKRAGRNRVVLDEGCRPAVAPLTLLSPMIERGTAAQRSTVFE